MRGSEAHAIGMKIDSGEATLFEIRRLAAWALVVGPWLDELDHDLTNSTNEGAVRVVAAMLVTRMKAVP